MSVTSPGAAPARLLAAGLLLSCLIVSPRGEAAAIQARPAPPTGTEAAGWARPTSHVEMLWFLSELQARTDRMMTRSIGRTGEGREIVAVFMGDPVLTDPTELSRSEKPTLLVTGTIHGNEPAGKEGALQLIRELVLGPDSGLLSRINVIVVPSMNPDGAEAGTRENARGYDLNRDWITAETPEVGAVLEQLVTRYWPDIFLDVHNGGALPYHLTYQTTLDPGADPELVALARGPIFEFLKERLTSREMSMFWYSGPAFDERREVWYWRTTEPLPRKQHSYAALQDMIALLFEIPEGHPPQLAADVARESMLGLLEFLSRKGHEVRSAVLEARRRTLKFPPAQIHLALQATPYRETEQFFVQSRPENGESRASSLVEGENRTRFVPTTSRSAPWGYAFDPGLEELAHLLRRHGIEVERLHDATTVPIERYRLDQVLRSLERYQRHRMTELRVEVEPGIETLAPGSFLVRVGQRGARLIPQLLEPEAVDSAARWNFLDSHLPEPGVAGSHLPLYRLNSHPGVSTSLLP